MLRHVARPAPCVGKSLPQTVVVDAAGFSALNTIWRAAARTCWQPFGFFAWPTRALSMAFGPNKVGKIVGRWFGVGLGLASVYIHELVGFLQEATTF